MFLHCPVRLSVLNPKFSVFSSSRNRVCVSASPAQFPEFQFTIQISFQDGGHSMSDYFSLKQNQYSKRYVMDIIVYCKVNWITSYTYIHTLTPNLYWWAKHGTITNNFFICRRILLRQFSVEFIYLFIVLQEAGTPQQLNTNYSGPFTKYQYLYKYRK
jgi:hypothetical protein